MDQIISSKHTPYGGNHGGELGDGEELYGEEHEHNHLHIDSKALNYLFENSGLSGVGTLVSNKQMQFLMDKEREDNNDVDSVKSAAAEPEEDLGDDPKLSAEEQEEDHNNNHLTYEEHADGLWNSLSSFLQVDSMTGNKQGSNLQVREGLSSTVQLQEQIAKLHLELDNMRQQLEYEQKRRKEALSERIHMQLHGEKSGKKFKI